MARQCKGLAAGVRQGASNPTVSPLPKLFHRVRGAAREAIARRMGGYRHPVHRDDPARPTQIPGAPPRVAVIGAGIAGLSAAAVLADRGARVTLLERENYLGGKCGAWEVQVDGETQRVDHGFHAFFRHYYNLRGLAERVGVTRHFASIDSYTILRRDRSRITIRDGETTPLLNLLDLARTGVYSVRDLLFSNRLHRLDPFLRYDEDETFAKWDSVSYESFCRDADLPRDLQVVFNTFARAFFSEGDRLSVAALVRAFHFYYLSNDAGLLYDYLDDDYETAFAAPFRTWLEARGVTLRVGEPVASLTPEGDRWRVGDECFDQVVLACDVKGARAIVEGSPALTERYPDFAAKMSRQRHGQRYAILRLWMDREVGEDLPVFAITDRVRLLDAVTFTHRVVPAARAWAARRGGAVYELHSYAVPDDIPGEALRDAMLQEFEHFFPALAGAAVLGEYLHVRDDFAAYHVNLHADRARVETGVAGLHLAGDWLRLPFPATLMEAACASGMLAANAILDTCGARQEPVYAVPSRGVLAR